MKVILLQDVAKIGLKNEIVDVPNGYGQNQLIPARKALPATPQNLKRVGKVHAELAAKSADSETMFTTALAALQAEPLLIRTQMNEQGHLFQAVHEKDVVEAAATNNIAITTQMVNFSEPIKTEGDHTVLLQTGQHNGSFTITVVKAE
jgi:large subunit ribosomal protein L9